MHTIFNREDHLADRVNKFLVNQLHLPDADYTNDLSLLSLLELKSILSCINNLITLKLTFGLADWICDTYELDDSIRDNLRRSILRTKPNANGFDLYLGLPIAFVAEVKCNVPVNGGSKYEANQKRSILADVESLLSGKRKASLMSQKVLKFLCFLDIPQVRDANAHLLKTTPDLVKKLRFVDPGRRPRSLSYVHGVYVTMTPNQSSQSTALP